MYWVCSLPVRRKNDQCSRIIPMHLEKDPVILIRIHDFEAYTLAIPNLQHRSTRFSHR